MIFVILAASRGLRKKITDRSPALHDFLDVRYFGYFLSSAGLTKRTTIARGTQRVLRRIWPRPLFFLPRQASLRNGRSFVQFHGFGYSSIFETQLFYLVFNSQLFILYANLHSHSPHAQVLLQSKMFCTFRHLCRGRVSFGQRESIRELNLQASSYFFITTFLQNLFETFPRFRDR